MSTPWSKNKKRMVFIVTGIAVLSVHSCMNGARGELRYEDELPRASPSPTHVSPTPIEAEGLDKRSRQAIERTRSEAALEMQEDPHYNDDSDQSIRGVITPDPSPGPSEDPRVEQREEERKQVIREMRHAL